MTTKTEHKLYQPLIAYGMDAAEHAGLDSVWREPAAYAAGCSVGMVNWVFGNMEGYRDAIVAEAIAAERLAIIAEAVIKRHPLAVAAPAELKRKALESLI